jgi:hypothetical protein
MTTLLLFMAAVTIVTYGAHFLDDVLEYGETIGGIIHTLIGVSVVTTLLAIIVLVFWLIPDSLTRNMQLYKWGLLFLLAWAFLCTNITSVLVIGVHEEGSKLQDKLYTFLIGGLTCLSAAAMSLALAGAWAVFEATEFGIPMALILGLTSVLLLVTDLLLLWLIMDRQQQVRALFAHLEKLWRALEKWIARK